MPVETKSVVCESEKHVFESSNPCGFSVFSLLSLLVEGVELLFVNIVWPVGPEQSSFFLGSLFEMGTHLNIFIVVSPMVTHFFSLENKSDQCLHNQKWRLAAVLLDFHLPVFHFVHSMHNTLNIILGPAASLCTHRTGHVHSELRIILGGKWKWNMKTAELRRCPCNLTFIRDNSSPLLMSNPCRIDLEIKKIPN